MSKKLGEKILDALDKVIAEPPKKSESGNRFVSPTVQLTPLAMRTVSASVQGDFITSGELAELRKAAKLYKHAWDTEIGHTRPHAIERWNKQTRDLAELIAAGKDIPDAEKIQSKEEWVSDYEEVIAACKLARRNISESVKPVIVRVFGRYADAIDQKLAVMKRGEAAQCEAVGLPWQPSADYLIHDAVARWARRNATPDASGVANPATALEGIGINL